jgi:methylated-DNA-[protein]-cysteine S-methyltransferase
MPSRKVASPLGILILTASDAGLERVDFAPDGVGCAGNPEPAVEGPALTWLERAVTWTDAFFEGRHDLPSLPPLLPAGTPFQQAVWQQLLSIPYGETVTYGQLAARVGRASASRAIGQANGANPIPLLIPCHRVIAGGGQLGGYSCGLDRKRWLLAHEARHAPFRLRLTEADSRNDDATRSD